jgi:hypothetical protein
LRGIGRIIGYEVKLFKAYLQHIWFPNILGDLLLPPYQFLACPTLFSVLFFRYLSSIRCKNENFLKFFINIVIKTKSGRVPLGCIRYLNSGQGSFDKFVGRVRKWVIFIDSLVLFDNIHA